MTICPIATGQIFIVNMTQSKRMLELRAKTMKVDVFNVMYLKLVKKKQRQQKLAALRVDFCFLLNCQSIHSFSFH